MSERAIVVDWGTSNFRAWLIERANGAVIEEISEGLGMAALEPTRFASYCQEQVGRWREDAATPVYMAGMVGAAQAWQAAPQLPLPVELPDLAARVVAADGLDDAWIVPGVRLAGDNPDVMRGEEVQIFGALALAGREHALLCLPGTHSKWARVEASTLVHFSTAMTGEIFALLLEHSILGRGASCSAAADASDAAFGLGLAQAERPGGLLHHLFSARARALYGGLAPTAIQSYLSGVLIGAEVAALRAVYPPEAQDLLLVSAGALRESYRRALESSGHGVRWIDARTASLRGMRAVIDLHRNA